MIRRVRFRWSDNVGVRDRLARRLWVETTKGNHHLLTFARLAELVGDAGQRRLVSVAIRRGAGRWHLAAARVVADVSEVA